MSSGKSQYDSRISEIRPSEFSHAAGVTYLDHAGATLYSKSQLEAHFKDLASCLYGNPHSQNQSSSLTTEAVNHVRRLVLQHFNTTSSSYDIVFTSGCTGALKLLSESFPFTRGGAQSSPLGGNTSSSSPDVGRKKDGPDTIPHFDSQKDIGSFRVWCPSRESDCISGHKEFCSPGQSVFCYLEDNHTSVVGMREVAAQRGAALVCVAREDVLLPGNAEEWGREQRDAALCQSEEVWSSQDDPRLSSCLLLKHGHTPLLPGPCHLFAYPAQSNFSGRKYPLSWTQDVPTGHVRIRGMEGVGGTWLVLLDAAAYVPTSPLDLSIFPAHFVSLSFYKMFGFPTGLGGLLVRKDVSCILHKSYYGGGTVLATISRLNFHLEKPLLHERFEDGTLPFLEIVSVAHGLNTLQHLAGSIEEVSIHTWALARYVYHNLKGLNHGNGQPVCVIYSDSDFEDRFSQGAIVALNFLRPTGEFVGYSEVDKLASVHNIHLRTGCFCNTGACMMFLGLSSKKVMENVKAGHVCGDDVDLINGVPTGCVRISFGYMSTSSDAQKFVEFVKQCFVNEQPSHIGAQAENIHPSEVPSTSIRPSEVPSMNIHPLEVPSMNIHPSEEPSTNIHPSEEPSMSIHPSEEPSMSIHPSEVPPMNTNPSDVLPMNTHPLRGGDKVPCDTAVVPPVCTGTGTSICVGDHMQVLKESGRGNDGTCCTVTVERIFLYPIKSCAAFEVSSWWLGTSGFQFDRLWMVVNERGSCLSQKQEPKLCLVQPAVDVKGSRLTLSAQGHNSISVPLEYVHHIPPLPNIDICQTTVCGDKVTGIDEGDEAAKWLSAVIGKKCRLWRQSPQEKRKAKKQPNNDGCVTLSLTNEAQFLLVARPSLEELLHLLQNSGSESSFIYEDVLLRFRPNLVVDGGIPFEEDSWSEIATASTVFKVIGQCSRCQMICVDQSTAKRSTKLLQVLLSMRGNKATFGVYLATNN